MALTDDQMHIAFDPELGKVPDSVIAERFGVTRQAVQYIRKQRNIPSYSQLRTQKEAELIEPLLGSTTDKDIAEQTGLTLARVRLVRKRLGRSAFKAPREHKPTTWTPEKLAVLRTLVTMTDMTRKQIGDHFGHSNICVVIGRHLPELVRTRQQTQPKEA